MGEIQAHIVPVTPKPDAAIELHLDLFERDAGLFVPIAQADQHVELTFILRPF